MGCEPITNQSQYHAAIRQAEGGAPSIIHIKAESNPVCKVTSPKVERMSETYTDVTFYKMELDASTSPMIKFGVQNTPIFVLMRGSKASTVLGNNMRELENAIKSMLAS